MLNPHCLLCILAEFLQIFPFRPFIHPPRGVQCQDQGCIKMTKMKMIMTKMRILTMTAIMTMTNILPRRPWWRWSCQRCGSRARSRSGTPPGRPLGMANAYCLEQPVRLCQFHHYDYYNHYVLEKDNPRKRPPLHRLRHFNSQNRHWQSL